MSNRQVFENLRKKAGAFRNTFNSPDGKKVFEALCQELDHDQIKSSDPYETYYRLGQRDLVVFIKQMIAYAEKQDG